MNLNVSDLLRCKGRPSSYVFPVEQQRISPAQVQLHMQETAHNHVISKCERPHNNPLVQEPSQFILASSCMKSSHLGFQQQNHNYPLR